MSIFEAWLNRLDVWVPLYLTGKILMDRIFIYDSLYKCKEEAQFLELVVMGDEKWIIYDDV